MATSLQVPNHVYQLWLNLVTKQLELHASCCGHLLEKQWRKYQRFGQPIVLVTQDDYDAMADRAKKLGEQFTVMPQNCAVQFYKGMA